MISGACLRMDSAAPRALGDDDRKKRKASRELRRQQLVDATIECLARRGFSETTLADVADAAGLSRGIVNFHFESKDKLLQATLQHMADEYAAHWRAALVRAGPKPADQLRAVVEMHFDRAISSRRKLAAWVAFWGEAKSRPTYKALCGARDVQYQETLVALCVALVAEGRRQVDPHAVALGLDSMLEGLWLRLMMGGEGVGRAEALSAARLHLEITFPEHFSGLSAAAAASEGKGETE